MYKQKYIKYKSKYLKMSQKGGLENRKKKKIF